MEIAKRLSVLQPTAVNRVLEEARPLRNAGRDLVSLMRGQPDTPTPLPIVEAAERALRAGRTGYPDIQGEPALRRAVAEKLLRDQQLTYDPASEILVTDGATLGIYAALGALVSPGEAVLLPDPIYDAYASVVVLWGGQPIGVRAVLRSGRFHLDRDALEAACTSRTRVLLLNNPWNPVGTVFTAAELSEILAFAGAHDVAIVSDEIYETLVYDGKQHISPAGLTAEARARTVVVSSLSKSYAMTGWRVGYCAGPSSVIAAMTLILQQSSRGPATFVQDAACCALRLDPDLLRRQAGEFQARRDLTVSQLSGIPGVIPLVPEGGLFVMLDVRGLGRSCDEVRRFLLHEAGVILIHGAAYGMGGAGTLRVSFAGGGETLTRGLERLRRGLERLAGRTV